TLRSLETAVPATALRQETVRDVLAAQPDLSRLGKRLVSTAFDSSGIEHRYSALTAWEGSPDEGEPVFVEAGTGRGLNPTPRGRRGNRLASPAFAPSGIEHRYSALTDWEGSPDEGEPVFFEAGTGRFLNPTTGARNRVYEREATRLYTQVAREALAAADGIEAADVTHVITVSCTGFFAPGPDYRIVRDLDLDPSVQRYHLGFMGCYAALPALRQAQTICRADPEAVVIVASVELCTLHVRTSNDPDTIVGSSLFADGAAGAVITGKELPATSALLRIDHFETVLTPVDEEAMAWNIGDNGFEMVLGTYVPHIIDEHITGALAPLLAHDPSLAERPYREIPHWAIHPGGRSILDKVEAKLALEAAQLVPARETLRD